MPIGRSSSLWAYVLASIATSLFTLMITFAVALTVGFRSSANILQWLTVAGILALFTFAPTETIPTALRLFAENQPVTSIVEATRALLHCKPIGNHIWIALAWCAGIMMVAWFFAMKAYKRQG